MLVWLGLILLAALLLLVGIEWLLRRLNVERQAPDEAGGGLRDVVERAGRYAEQREQERRERRDRR